MTQEPATRTGLARAKLAEVVRSDLTEIADLLQQAVSKLEALRLESGGLNGLESKLEERICLLRPVGAELRADASAYHQALTLLGERSAAEGPVQEPLAREEEGVVPLEQGRARARG